MTNLPKPPLDTRNPPKPTTKEEWDRLSQPAQVRSLNVLAQTPEQLKEAFRKL
jgi:hypothetical protein